ncbi:MAG: hypothetical protein LLF83_05995 [Methanobacterium sp.]|nr:hypothetical protein [Methanobacterium sp.]
MYNYLPLTASLSMFMVLLALYSIFVLQQYVASNLVVAILFAVIFGLSVFRIRIRSKEDVTPVTA